LRRELFHGMNSFSSLVRSPALLGLLGALLTDPIAARAASAVNGKLSGSVLSTESGRGISGVTVTLQGTGQQATTTLEGTFMFEGLPAGKYQVSALKTGYQPIRVNGIAVRSGETSRVDLPLATMSDPVLQLEAFTVSADVVQNSGLGLLSARQKAAAVSDAIGSEQMSRLGFGTAASAMKAVTGASVVGGKYVYIRGLGERYSSTMVNGVEVPSADPDRRAVNMDMFASELIDAIVTTKSFTPDKPGNFTGGAVDMKTKEFPDQFTLSFAGSFAFNSRVTGRDFLSSGAGTNAWGRDNGDRDLPAALTGRTIPLRFTSPDVDAEIGELTRAFNPTMTPGLRNAPINRSFSAAVGGVSRLFGRRLGYAASLSYDRSFSGHTDGVFGRYERQGVNSPSLAPLVVLNDVRSEDDALIGGLLNLAYQFNPEHQVSLNTMFNQSGNDMARMQSGLNVAGGGISETEIFTTRTLRYTERSLRSMQLAGKHLFPWHDLRLNWGASHAATTQDEPDTRYFSTFQTQDGNEFFEASGLPRPSRYFRDLEEKRRDYSFDLTLPIGVGQERQGLIKAGAANATTEREFNERLFEYSSTVLRYDGNAGDFLRASQVGRVDSQTSRFRPGQLYLVETTSSGNSYVGEQEVRAFYGMVDLPITRALRFIGGARQESTKLDVRSRDPRRRAGLLDNSDTLPSANFVYALSDRMNLRAAFTKTIARPNFREIADYTSFEFVGDFVYIGNPNLRRTKIKNYDLRWEWFPRKGELLAVSAFHKQMAEPIERGVFSIINSGELQYQNAPRGEVTGIEIEARKRLDFVSDRLRNWSAGFNYTWVESCVEIAPSELDFIRFYDPEAKSTRELTGQSPYVANFDLTFSDTRLGTTVSIYYNLFGQRLSQVSPPGTPNIFEQPAPTLDLIWAQRFASRWKFTLAARNLLDRPAEQTYSYRGIDYLRASYRRGITTSLGVSYTF
jgi:outer membrane receptor protein involved in Fe transport